MGKYLVRGQYTPEGVRSVLQDGGTARVQAVKQLIEGLGGTVEAYYICLW